MTALLPYLAGAKELAVVFAAVTGAIVAIKGLNSWRRQLRGKTEYEAAVGLLRAVYKVRDAIALVRVAFMDSGELAHALRIEGVRQSGEAAPDAIALAYSVRWNAVREAMSALQIAALEAEVHWRIQPRDLLVPLFKCVSELNWAVGYHLRAKAGHFMESTNELDSAAHAVVYSLGEDDPFSLKVREAVKPAETFARARIGASD